METKRIYLKTDQYGKLLYQPTLPPNVRIEAIFIIAEEKNKNKRKRKPSPVIFGKGRIIGDIVAPASPPQDWDVLQ